MESRFYSHFWLNLFHTFLLFAAMGLQLALLGWVIAGSDGAFLALFSGLLVLFLLPKVSPALVLRSYGARPLPRERAPEIHAILRELARRAGLPAVPGLFYLPEPNPVAFSTGDRNQPAVVLSSGLVNLLEPEEIAGVLAHETAHLKNNDVRLMNLADAMSRITGAFSLAGQGLVLVLLPLYLLGGEMPPWGAILLLLAAPYLSALIQLGLSRVREYHADATAVWLAGEAEGLASALEKLEYGSRNWWARIFLPDREEAPSLFRTHPETGKRLERLRSLAGASPFPPLVERRPRVPVELFLAAPRTLLDRYFRNLGF